jgi:2-deoxy-D-gluconate 3-dehydrogenase
MSILNAFDLSGKVALVTGSERGLGQGMTLALAEAGADIAGHSYRSSGETESLVQALGRRYAPFPLDLIGASAAEIGGLIDAVVAEFGRIDILVNNAGIIRRAPALEFAVDDWHDVLSINLNAIFFLSQAAGRAFERQGEGGKIVNIASLLSYQGGITVPAYTAAKHGVAGLTKALANEWAGRGINVNAIAPGYMATDNTAALQADEKRNQSILERIPAGRWGTPADLQGTVVFLASAASDYVNGVILPVDGGWLAR